MSPLHIEILLYHHYTPTNHPYMESDAVKGDRATLLEFVDRDFLVIFNDGFTLSEKGKVYVDAIINVPEPVERTIWEIPNHRKD